MPVGLSFKVMEKMSDRDPDSGRPFPSVLAMREAKLRDWLASADRLGHSDHIACRDFMLDPVLAHTHTKTHTIHHHHHHHHHHISIPFITYFPTIFLCFLMP